MSLQVFLQAQLLGAEEFLAAPPKEQPDDAADFIGRSAWVSLICEVLPRALLSELKLSRMLLGSSSAEQFFLVLAEEDIPRANEFLHAADVALNEISEGALHLHWAGTENLGAWPIARKRLDDALAARTSAPLSRREDAAAFFAPLEDTIGKAPGQYFTLFAAQLASASKVGWSPDRPAHLLWDDGQYSWPLKEQSAEEEDGILFPRRFAMDEDATRTSSLAELAERGEGTFGWGVLRGDVDQFEARLKRAATIEEHIHISVLFKKFVAGELAFLCTLPEFWRRVTIVYRGGDDFAAVGSWDALIALARELHRVFESFAEENLAAFAGVESKTISMALVIAPEIDTPLSAVFEEAGLRLRGTKANEPGSLYLFGRTLEWNRLADAEELKTSLVRMVREFGVARDYIADLTSVYRDSFSARAARRVKTVRSDKPWRTYMRVSRVIPASRGKEAANLRNTIITHLLGKKTAGLKLRPSARVGLEWARLAAGN